VTRVQTCALPILCQFKEIKKHPKRLLSLGWAALCSLLLSAAYFLPMIEQLRHTKFVLTQSNGILPKGATSFFDMSKWSLNNGLGEPNIGIVLFIAAVVIVLSFTKIKDKAIKDFALIGVILLLCST